MERKNAPMILMGFVAPEGAEIPQMVAEMFCIKTAELLAKIGGFREGFRLTGLVEDVVSLGKKTLDKIEDGERFEREAKKICLCGKCDTEAKTDCPEGKPEESKISVEDVKKGLSL